MRPLSSAEVLRSTTHDVIIHGIVPIINKILNCGSLWNSFYESPFLEADPRLVLKYLFFGSIIIYFRSYKWTLFVVNLDKR